MSEENKLYVCDSEEEEEEEEFKGDDGMIVLIGKVISEDGSG